MPPPPNLAISIQLTMKLGKDILCIGRTLYKLTKIVDDVIKMRQLKYRRFPRVLAEYLKNDSTDFHKTYVFLGNRI